MKLYITFAVMIIQEIEGMVLDELSVCYNTLPPQKMVIGLMNNSYKKVCKEYKSISGIDVADVNTINIYGVEVEILKVD